MSVLNLAALAAFVAAPVSRNAGPRNASLLTIEEARAAVVASVTDPKGSDHVGKKFVNLKLGQRNVSLEVIAPKAARLVIEPAQAEEVSATLIEEVLKGTFDEAIVVAQGEIKASYEAAQAKKEKAKLEADTPAATEAEAIEAAGDLDLEALQDELDI